MVGNRDPLGVKFLVRRFSFIVSRFSLTRPGNPYKSRSLAQRETRNEKRVLLCSSDVENVGRDPRAAGRLGADTAGGTQTNRETALAARAREAALDYAGGARHIR